MRKLVFNIVAILCAVNLHNSLAGSASYAKDYEKVIRKEFAIVESGEVIIKNRYGKVNVNTTGGNEVVIEVTIKVDKGNEDDAQEFFDKVIINFNNSRSEVSARTEIGKQKKSSWTSWLNPKNWNNSNNYSVNYEVWMPATCKLDLTNKYGDIAVGDIENDVRLELKYGDGILEDIDGDLELDLGYGDIKLGAVNDVELDIKYGEFKCKSSRDVDCDSKYSKIHINKARKLVSDTGYDDFFLGEIETLINEGHYDDFVIEYVDQINFDSKYSDYVIEEMGSGGVFNSNYGDLNVKKVNGLSRGLDIEGSYSDVLLRMNIPFNINLDSKYTDVNIPKDLEYKTRIRDGNKESIEAKRGNSTSNNIEVEMRYGSFNIKPGY